MDALSVRGKLQGLFWETTRFSDAPILFFDFVIPCYFKHPFTLCCGCIRATYLPQFGLLRNVLGQNMRTYLSKVPLEMGVEGGVWPCGCEIGVLAQTSPEFFLMCDISQVKVVAFDTPMLCESLLQRRRMSLFWEPTPWSQARLWNEALVGGMPFQQVATAWAGDLFFSHCFVYIDRLYK